MDLQRGASQWGTEFFRSEFEFSNEQSQMTWQSFKENPPLGDFTNEALFDFYMSRPQKATLCPNIGHIRSWRVIFTFMLILSAFLSLPTAALVLFVSGSTVNGIYHLCMFLQNLNILGLKINIGFKGIIHYSTDEVKSGNLFAQFLRIFLLNPLRNMAVKSCMFILRQCCNMFLMAWLLYDMTRVGCQVLALLPEYILTGIKSRYMNRSYNLFEACWTGINTAWAGIKQYVSKLSSQYDIIQKQPEMCQIRFYLYSCNQWFNFKNIYTVRSAILRVSGGVAVSSAALVAVLLHPFIPSNSAGDQKHESNGLVPS